MGRLNWRRCFEGTAMPAGVPEAGKTRRAAGRKTEREQSPGQSRKTPGAGRTERSGKTEGAGSTWQNPAVP